MIQVMKLPMTTKLAVVLVGACVAAGLGSLRGAPRGEAMDGWQVEDLVARLHQHGLEFRASPTRINGSVNQGAILTTTDKSFLELDGVGVFPEYVGQWQGTVKCYVVSRRFPQFAPRTELWTEECYCRVGPFILFGDPELRARICQVFTDAGVSLN
jgi:hypothetical protein